MSLPTRFRDFFLLWGAFWLLALRSGAGGAGGAPAVPPALPPPPEGMILDQGRILLPEAAGALSLRLRAAASGRSIWVYVVTVPSLGVQPSRQKERMVNLAHFYRDGWLKGMVGVLLLVDDESGNAIIVATDETNRLYPPLRRNMLLDEPLRLAQREMLVRTKVEQTALAVVQVLSRLQDEDKAHARRDRVATLVMAGVALAGLGIVVVVELAKARRRRAAAP